MSVLEILPQFTRLTYRMGMEYIRRYGGCEYRRNLC